MISENEAQPTESRNSRLRFGFACVSYPSNACAFICNRRCACVPIEDQAPFGCDPTSAKPAERRASTLRAALAQ